MTDPISTDDRAALGWLFSFVRPHGRRLALVVLVALVSTALVLLQPLLIKLLIDDGILAGDFFTVVQICLAMLAVALVGALLGGLNRYQHVAVSADILFALRHELFRHLQRLPPTFYARWRSGDLLARLDGDVAEVQRFAVDALLAAISATLGLLGAFALMLALSWQLSLIAFVLLPLELLFLRRLRPRVEATARALRERGSDLAAFLVERLGTMKFTQSVAAEAREAGVLDALQGRFRADLLRQQMTGYLAGAVPGLLTTASTALVFVIGGWLVIQGSLTLGTLVAFAAYLGRATGPVQSLLGLYVAAQRALVSLRRVAELQREQPAVTSPAQPKAATARGGAVRFERVRFGYGGDEILQGVDLAIVPGEKVGLIGLSGAGKTTLIDLLQRHYDPAGGRILLDGVDLRELDLGELRRRITVVAQDTVLLKGSLLDNLRYATPGASAAEVRAAARRAEIDAFASALPDGYASDVGTAGSALSGGQRQRIAIARALLQDPLVLVLDEATSAVDEATEAAIIRAVDELFRDRTRIVISHRAATLAGVDRLIALERGRLVERQPIPAAR
ncbi:MAG TPA: ABC transporter ATP-binding protein [Geminicoccaceae bacterium]|nr:ABC transporter ATP-binding protein [Geminicoccaceae bacterium]